MAAFNLAGLLSDMHVIIFKVFLENDDEDVRQVRVYSNNVTNMKLS